MTIRQFTVRDVFVHMRELLEKGWCQGTFVCDAAGRRLDEKHPSVDQYCILGALRTLYGVPHVSTAVYDDAFTRIDARIHNMVAWNDSRTRTQADVLRLLDELIAAA